MKKVTIAPWEFFKFQELWKITQMKDGCIYKTKNTGLFIHDHAPIPDGYCKATIAYTGDLMDLNVWEPGDPLP